MNGEQLYNAWTAALAVDWPRTQRYSQVFGTPEPPVPVAWDFLHGTMQKGWNNFAEAFEDIA